MDDVSCFAEPMFQDGIIAQAVDTVVVAGVPYVSSAANAGKSSYESAFNNSGVNLGTGVTGLVSDSPTFIAHDFDSGPGVDLFQTITLTSSSNLFSFQWDAPFFSVSGGAGALTDMNLAVFSEGGTYLGSANAANIGGDAAETFGQTPGKYQFAIGKFAGPDPGLIKYVSFRSSATINEYATNSSTCYGHANAAGASAVGAAPFFQTPVFGQTPPLLESFSSRGGIPILFDTAGNSVGPIGRQSPDITAPDGTNTTFFGSDIPQDADTFPNFFGTSRAAPHAAAVAALMLQANPALTPAADYSGLETTANISSGAPLNTGNLDAIDGVVVIDGSASGAVLNISASGSTNPDQVTNDAFTAPNFPITGTARGGWEVRTFSASTGGVNLSLGSGDDDVDLVSVFAGEPITLDTGGGDDEVDFGDGVDLAGGTIAGAIGTDTIDYTAYPTQVAVNLGLGSTSLGATLDSTQEVPANASTASETAAITNYSVADKTFDLPITVSNMNPADVTGLHLHRAGVGLNGPVLIDLLALCTLVPVGSGFTLTLTGVDLDASLLGGAANEAAFLGGQTYINIHTPTVPGGEIRGQVFSNANLSTLRVGTATGTAGITDFENAIGGAADDSLVGNLAANTLNGLGGNDTILGGPGADTFLGGANDDVMVGSNGEGSDVMDGEAKSDTVAVNGNVTGNDEFTVGANGTRVDFDRVSAGPFSLDIGTTETMRVNGVGGADKMTVNSLAGVADLTELNLNGLDGNDTFNVARPRPSPSRSAGTSRGARGWATR